MTSSMAIRNVASRCQRGGVGMYESTVCMSSMMASTHFCSPLRAPSAEPEDDEEVVAGKSYSREKLTGLHLDEVNELLVVDHVALVQEDDDVGYADLTSEKDVLTSLSHGAIGSRDDENGTVHLGCARDHVLDVVGMARAVDVGVVALPGLVSMWATLMVMPR